MFFILTNVDTYGLASYKIGNSKGIRLSKTILQKYEIKDTVELVLEEDFIILKPKHIARKGWGR